MGSQTLNCRPWLVSAEAIRQNPQGRAQGVIGLCPACIDATAGPSRSPTWAGLVGGQRGSRCNLIPPTLQLPLPGHGHIALSAPRSFDCRVVRELINQDSVSLDRCHSVPAGRDRHFQHRARTTGVAHAPRITRRNARHDGKQPPEGREVHTLGSRLLRPYPDKRDSKEGQLGTSFRKCRPQVTLQSLQSHRVCMAWTLANPTTHPLNHLDSFTGPKTRQKKDKSQTPRTSRALIGQPPSSPAPSPSSNRRHEALFSPIPSHVGHTHSTSPFPPSMQPSTMLLEGAQNTCRSRTPALPAPFGGTDGLLRPPKPRSGARTVDL